MKTNEVPEKIYVSIHSGIHHYEQKNDDDVEYTRTDAFIERACEKLEKCMYDNLMFQGRLHRKEVIETFIADFKNFLKTNKIWHNT